MPMNYRLVSTYSPSRCGIGVYAGQVAHAAELLTGEVRSFRVAALLGDKEDPASYEHNPVDMTIYKNGSWKRGISAIVERAQEMEGPTVAVVAFEYGLGHKDNYLAMLRAFRDAGIITLTDVHTILWDPDDYQRETIQGIAENSDGLFIHTKRGMNVLKSEIYGIDELKLKHIPHGVRLCSSKFDRLDIKRECGWENKMVSGMLGMRNPDKGIQYGIRAQAKFVTKSLSKSQRRDMLFVIEGGCHPEFIAQDGGKPYREYEHMLQTELSNSGLRYATLSDSKDFPDDIKSRPLRDFSKLDFDKLDIIFSDNFLNEEQLMQRYTVLNVIKMPYLNLQQAVSGVFSDVIGSGRVGLATKFDHACEDLNPNDNPNIPYGDGLWGPEEIKARGYLLDPGEAYVDQAAWALDHLFIEGNGDGEMRGQKWRLHLERNAFQHGYAMRWPNVVWQMVDHARNIYLDKTTMTGRGQTFTRDKESGLVKPKIIHLEDYPQRIEKPERTFKRKKRA